MAEVKFELTPIELGQLLPHCSEYKLNGWRLCQIHSVRTKTGYELTYTFAKEYDMVNLRVVIDEDTEVPSITPIYACAWLYENEVAELFGVNITNIRMSYDKKLYKLKVETPFK